MSNPIPHVNKILAVASGKGGVGKTTVAVNLALALAARGARVGIFDADIYGPNVPLMLGVHRAQSARGLVPIARVGSDPYIQPLDRYGLKVMSVGLLVGERDAVMPDPHDAAKIVTQTLRDVVWGELDYLVIDLPPGTGEPQHSLVRQFQIDGVVVVTTPQDLSLLDAGRSLGMFRQSRIPILGIVENMSYLICPHCGDQIEVFYRSERAWVVQSEELEVLGRVPMHIAISQGIDAGNLLMQAAPSATEVTVFRTVADRVAELLGN